VDSVLAERSDRLQRDGQRFGQDILFAFLAVVDELVLPLLWRKENTRPLGRQVLLLGEQADELLALFFGHDRYTSTRRGLSATQHNSERDNALTDIMLAHGA